MAFVTLLGLLPALAPCAQDGFSCGGGRQNRFSKDVLRPFRLRRVAERYLNVEEIFQVELECRRLRLEILS